MKIQNIKIKTFDLIQNEIYFCTSAYLITSVIFFSMHFKFNKLWGIIVTAHCGLFSVATISYIIVLVLVRKYLKLYLLPACFILFLLGYKYYHTVFFAMCLQLMPFEREPHSHYHLLDSIFMYASFSFFLMSTWYFSHHIYRIFKNSITIFSPSKNN